MSGSSKLDTPGVAIPQNLSVLRKDLASVFQLSCKGKYVSQKCSFFFPSMEVRFCAATYIIVINVVKEYISSLFFYSNQNET